MDNKCQCDMRTKLVGDGCRYCNPQEYIDKLIEQIDETPEIDYEAIAWAYQKLVNFGVHQNTMENAMMADRIEFMLKMA